MYSVGKKHPTQRTMQIICSIANYFALNPIKLNHRRPYLKEAFFYVQIAILLLYAVLAAWRVEESTTTEKYNVLMNFLDYYISVGGVYLSWAHSIHNLSDYGRRLEGIREFDAKLHRLGAKVAGNSVNRLIYGGQFVYILLALYTYIYSYVFKVEIVESMNRLVWLKYTLPHFIIDMNVILLASNLCLIVERFYALHQVMDSILARKHQPEQQIVTVTECFVLLREFAVYLNSGFNVFLLSLFLTSIISGTNTVYVGLVDEEMSVYLTVSVVNAIAFSALNLALIVLPCHIVANQANSKIPSFFLFFLLTIQL